DRQGEVLAEAEVLRGDDGRCEGGDGAVRARVEQVPVVIEHVDVDEHDPDLLLRGDAQLLHVHHLRFADPAIDHPREFDRVWPRAGAAAPIPAWVAAGSAATPSGCPRGSWSTAAGGHPVAIHRGDTSRRSTSPSPSGTRRM